MKFLSLRWKISGILIISNLLLGIVLVIILNNTIAEGLGRELIERGRTIARNLSQYSAEKIISEDIVGLKELLTESQNFESVAYLLIYDSESAVLTDTYNGQIPKTLLAVSPKVAVEREKSSLLYIEESNEECYDIWVAVEDGYLGYIRVGMKKDYVVKSIQKTTIIVLLTIVIVTIIGILIVILLANKIIQPILYLTKSAEDISKGKLDEPVGVKTNDEIQQLAQALDRLRESVKIALERLKKHQTLRM